MAQNHTRGYLILLYVAICALTVVFFHSCRISAPGKSDLAQTPSVPRIIFLNYLARISRESGAVEIKLIDKTITDGKIKAGIPSEVNPRPGDLVCISLNGQMRPTDSIPVSDPLNISVESVGDNSALFRKEISLDSAEFTVRVQLKPDTRAIALRKRTVSGNQNPYLIVTNITEP